MSTYTDQQQRELDQAFERDIAAQFERKIAFARMIVNTAEADLGTLTAGQRRDLMADRTEWSMDTIAAVVREL